MRIVTSGINAIWISITFACTLKAQVAPSEMFGSVEIVIGMPEADAVHALSSSFVVTYLTGVKGAIDIREKGSSATQLSVGNLSIRDGRVWRISKDWTPRNDTGAALADALTVMLRHLTQDRGHAQWRVGEPCRVLNTDFEAGVDTQGSMTYIECGRQSVMLTEQRTPGGSPSYSLEMETE